MKNRFHNKVRCIKCGRIMVKDRTLADCWLILFTGKMTCEHEFKPYSSSVVTEGKTQ